MNTIERTDGGGLGRNTLRAVERALMEAEYYITRSGYRTVCVCLPYRSLSELEVSMALSTLGRGLNLRPVEVGGQYTDTLTGEVKPIVGWQIF